MIWCFYSRAHSYGKTCNVVLISIDTCRADHLSCYGCRRKTTPNIDAVAAEGILFENVVSPIPLTLPAHSSMLTGTNPVYHGVHDNEEYQLGNFNVTLAEILKDKGFTTGAVISAVVLDSQFGIDQGFDSFNDRFEKEHKTPGGISERIGAEATGFALDWLEENKDKRFFFFLHYYDPHSPYEPSEPFASEFADRPYAGEIAYTDYCVGQVLAKLKELDLYDSTLIIITSDHGEMLGEHSESSHSYFIYQSAIKVPLIFKLPGQHKPKRVKQLAGIIDIMPTICSLLNIKPSSVVHGTDLSDCLEGKNPDNRQRYLYCESLTPTKYNANPLLGLVTDRFKYIQTTRPELYDLVKDWAESDNLVNKQPKTARLLKENLKLILEEQLRKNDSDSKLELDTQTLDKLKGLGYVGGSVSEDFDFDQTKDDPKDLIEFHKYAQIVYRLISEKKYAEAEVLCKKLISERPDIVVGHHHMAIIALEQGDLDKALLHLKKEIEHLYRELELDPDRYGTHSSLGKAFIHMDNGREAVKHLSRAVEIRPEFAESHFSLGTAFQSQDRFDEAAECYRQALQIKPDYVEAHFNLGIVLKAQDKVDASAHHYRQAVKIDPEHADARYNLANLLQSQGRFEESASLYRQVLKIDPDYVYAHYNLGRSFQLQGRTDEAINCFRQTLRIKPDYAEAHYNMGIILRAQGKLDEAAAHYQKAIQIKPDYIEVYGNIGNMLLAQGKYDEVINHFNDALRIKPDWPQAHNYLGNIYCQQGRFDLAVTHWTETMKLRPDFAEVINNLAWVLAAHRDEKFHNPAKAVKLARRACELTDYKKPNFLDTLGIAYAASGDFAKATETAQKAVELAAEAGNEEMAADIQDRLRLYKSGSY